MAKTLEEFKRWYTAEQTVSFQFELARSPYIDYHYEFIQGKDRFSWHVWLTFKQRGAEGARYLLDKLKHIDEPKQIAEIIFMLGCIADKLRIETEQTLFCTILEKVQETVLSQEDYIRDRSIIVLGWIGNQDTLPLLAKILLHDPNPQCRAWSASSFMQMNFRLKRKQNQLDNHYIFPLLKQAISQETDLFALGTMIISLQEIAGKKFKLSGAAVEDRKKEAIEKAQKSALNFLVKWEKQQNQK